MSKIAAQVLEWPGIWRFRPADGGAEQQAGGQREPARYPQKTCASSPPSSRTQAKAAAFGSTVAKRSASAANAARCTSVAGTTPLPKASGKSRVAHAAATTVDT